MKINSVNKFLVMYKDYVKWVLDDSKGKLNAKIWHSNDAQLNMQHPYQLINTNI